MGAIFLCFRSGGAGGCGGVKTPPYEVKDKGDAKRNRELTQGCGPGMPGPYGLL